MTSTGAKLLDIGHAWTVEDATSPYAGKSVAVRARQVKAGNGTVTPSEFVAIEVTILVEGTAVHEAKVPAIVPKGRQDMIAHHVYVLSQVSYEGSVFQPLLVAFTKKCGFDPEGMRIFMTKDPNPELVDIPER